MDSPTFRLGGRQFQFTPFGGPIDQEPEHPIFAELGYAVATWARLEHILTALVMHINKEETAPELHNPDPQSKFSGLLKLLRKWLTEHPGYSHLTTEDDALLFDSLLGYADLRNEIAHSFLESIDPKTSAFTMRRLRRVGKDLWEPSTTTYDPAALRHLASQTSLATRHFAEIAKLVFLQGSTEQSQTQ